MDGWSIEYSATPPYVNLCLEMTENGKLFLFNPWLFAKCDKTRPEKCWHSGLQMFLDDKSCKQDSSFMLPVI